MGWSKFVGAARIIDFCGCFVPACSRMCFTRLRDDFQRWRVFHVRMLHKMQQYFRMEAFQQSKEIKDEVS